MGLYALFVLALISTAAAAPWRCYRTSDGSTVCFGEVGQPTINPPSICINRPAQPCSGSATVFTPPCNPCAPSNPCNSFVPCNPCPPLQPCDPSNPCNQCDSCMPRNPCEPCNQCLY